MKKPELLAPAGSFEAMIGAFAAGADAVYLGGNAFGARAFAENFTVDQICESIRYAHLLRKKIYCTVNTLTKEKEFADLYRFLLPLYEAGLDAVIVQDFGVFLFIKEHFPSLSLHVSTQMTVTGPFGASYLKSIGAERVVPARELSLAECRAIKQDADIEVEAFIHGAMCYCYSGQCLLSSILGGRSGNRGRCAQPCRLPYHVEHGKECYPLSMKDMCTVSILPELIDAGIDSFKIEGRMKKPEYAAGVTAIYRHYIDDYASLCATGQRDRYKVKDTDLNTLKSLYLRSSLSEGYYHKKNGRDLVTISSPSYNGSDEELLQSIRNRFLLGKKTLPVHMIVSLAVGEPVSLSVTCEDMTVTCTGDIVLPATSRPVSETKVKEQLGKTGGTNFHPENITVILNGDGFLPISSLNQLRREALYQLEEELLCNHLPNRVPARSYDDLMEIHSIPLNNAPKKESLNYSDCTPVMHVLVRTLDQLSATLSSCPGRIYIEYDLALQESAQQMIRAYRQSEPCAFYIALPYIYRTPNQHLMDTLYRLLEGDLFDGCLVRNLEEATYLRERKINQQIVADACLYAWNRRSVQFLKELCDEWYLPEELNGAELRDLCAGLTDETMQLIVYGKRPVMISAGCVAKTTGTCRKESGFSVLTDRMKKDFPVYRDCGSCTNIIYNGLPLSLHRALMDRKWLPDVCRLDFTTENRSECVNILHQFQNLISGVSSAVCYSDFTTGHFKRGVK